MFQTEFVVSDLHMGDKGPRDNFAAMSKGYRENEFLGFLDYVESNNGRLRIVGDLFELWQGNISRVLTCRMPLIDRLAAMGAVYQLGNHDIDLKYFVNTFRIGHRLFDNLISTPQSILRSGRRIVFIHGHMEDAYCSNECPDMGRVSAIYTGLKEDKNGGPLLRKYKYRTVEADTLGRIFWFMNAWGWLLRKPNHGLCMRKAVLATFNDGNTDALFYGHTHEPGQFYTKLGSDERHWGAYENKALPIYNLGTWAEQKNTFGTVDDNGTCALLDWVDGKPVENQDVLWV